LFEDDRHFEADRKVTLRGRFGEREAQVEFFRRQHGNCVLKFRGIDTIEAAEKIVGAEIRILRSELLPLDEGSFYTFQLKGCSVYDKGEYIGVVNDVLDTGAAEILKVDRDDDETLIPFAQSYLKNVDLAQRRIDVDLPEGLREINK
jgi:16S rRNA processing protein RimM